MQINSYETTVVAPSVLLQVVTVTLRLQWNNISVLTASTYTMTTCSICLEDFTDPRVLPTCGHSLCLACLRGICRDKLPGTRAPCPLCRADFTIPPGGVGAFAVNFALMELLECEKTALRKEPHVKTTGIFSTF